MELTEDKLEYVAFVARRYCIPDEFTDDDTLELAELTATDIFKNRFSILEEQYNDKYEEFISNLEIQKTLTIYNLNPDKFWLLFLFATDFTNSCFNYEIKSPPTTRETIMDLYDMLNDTLQIKRELHTEYENPHNTQLILKTEGKTVSTDNPILLHLFKKFCAEHLLSVDNSLDIVPYWSSTTEEDKVRTRKMKFFVELFRYFLDAHITAVKPSKMTFIGRFLYLANIAEQEWFYTSYLHTPITKRNRFMIKQFGTVTLNGIEYIREPVDVGKKVADTIKKCTDYAPISTSNYFYVIS